MNTMKIIIEKLKKEKILDSYKGGYSETENHIIFHINRNISCRELVSKRMVKNFNEKGYQANTSIDDKSVIVKPQNLLDSIDNCFDI